MKDERERWCWFLLGFCAGCCFIAMWQVAIIHVYTVP